MLPSTKQYLCDCGTTKDYRKTKTVIIWQCNQIVMSYHHQNVLKRKYMNHLIAMVIVNYTKTTTNFLWKYAKNR